ncbi:M13-type metalloendopeptidase [Croceicoccus mobilis]|uniref:Peptidase M13 n=1 Tax=Croceicoccus mobilis TaxID=1703339 RepID=A0A916YY75_9SPHN|nr:M13 family metallopeptidase [Croceicoccus mobilis]GGD66627.1 peptidase M13 [Croceicoccus mobilis]
MDTAVDPGNDFYRYANGNWLRNAVVPADASNVSRTSAAEAELDRRLTSIVEDIAGRPQDRGTPEALVRDYYRYYMDREMIDRLGLKPASSFIERIDGIEDVAGLSRAIGTTLRADAEPLAGKQSENLFAVSVLPAPTGKNAAAWLLPGGLGLPDREAYLLESSAARATRAAYRDYVARILSRGGRTGATARANAVLDLEVKLAEAQGAAQDLSQARMLSAEELQEEAPGIDWAGLLAAAGLGDEAQIAVVDAEAIARISTLAKEVPLDAWKDWLIFHRLSTHANVLPAEFARARYVFYGQRMGVMDDGGSREELATHQISSLFGGTLSRLYAARYFSEEERKDVSIIVDRIRRAMADGLPDGADGTAALEELTVATGFPDEYEELTDLGPFAANAYGMTVAAERAAYRQELGLLGKPYDPTRWVTGTQDMQVRYLPLQNVLEVPAALLQPPFYDPEADASANYGGIGGIVGKSLANAAGAAHPTIAGLAAAYEGYRASLGGKEPRVIEGYTGDQRFFIAFAQLQAVKTAREASAITQGAKDDANAVRNLDAWYRAFDVQPSDELYQPAAERLTGW